MLNTIVLDACTIINLLRIDDLDGFIMKKLNNYVLAIPEKVLQEVHLNSKKNKLNEEREDFIDRNTPFFHSYIVTNSDIKKQNEMWTYVVEAAGHYHKENGELYSTVLCLIESRKEQTRSILYTDDYPAAKTFHTIFMNQQIGYISDTAHFLLYLFSNSTANDFEKSRLIHFLQNLLAEYNRDMNNIVELAKIQMATTNLHKKDKQLYIALDKIIEGFYGGKDAMFYEGLQFFANNKSKNKEISRVLESTTLLVSDSIPTKSIKSLITDVNKYGVFQHTI